MNKSIFVFSLLMVSIGMSAQQVKVVSPDGNIEMTVNNQEKLSYSVTYKGRTMVGESPISFEFKGEKPMVGNYLMLNNPASQSKEESWKPAVANKHSQISVAWNEATLQLKEKEGACRRLDVNIRVYNDGVAFRYQLFKTHKVGSRLLTNEATHFALPQDASVWIAKQKGKWNGGQEQEYRKSPLDSLKADSYAFLPFLVEVSQDAYMAITDAYIDNYPGCFMGKDADGLPVTKLAPLPGEDENGVKARIDKAMWTPWRVLMIGDNLGTLIESEIVRAVNPPCAIEDPSWIKPGMSAWDHWWSGEVKMEMPVIKDYIDFASAQGWPYMLIDWQWYGEYNKARADVKTTAPQIDIPELLGYAKEKNVRLWVWLYCTDITNNDVTDEAFALYEKWGLAGVKIDFMNRMDQEMVNWYRMICEKAAKHHLMVDFHGAYRPDGIDRTWPNQVTREGVLGEEYYKFSTRMVPEHNVTLAFTRMLAGAMDYTPGGFLNVPFSSLTKEEIDKMNHNKSIIPARVFNTRCAELAKFVIYESPLTVFSDHPSHVLGQPGADFVSQVPTVWDNIKFLGGYPDEYVALAKQTGKQWYVGVLNNSVKRKLTLDTSFLPAGKYSLTYWKDAKNADKQLTALDKKTISFVPGKPLIVEMASCGGYVGIFTPTE